jgi:hypothetical protein
MPKCRPLRNPIFIAATWLAFLMAGCGFGSRFIFSSSADTVGTPDQVGMDYEDVWFRAADGVRLHGWYVPAEADRPLVLFFHGNAANITHRVPNLQYLHGLGLPVFIFDYRGYGTSKGRSLHEEDLYRDARGALDWLRARGWKPERMIFFGRSLGAAVALHMALESPPGGVVLEAPFTSLRDIGRETTPVIYALFGWWGIDAQFDNLKKIPLLCRPLLIFHGDRDRTIPHEMSLRLFELAREPKTLRLVPGARHSDAFAVGGEYYRQGWQVFLDQVFEPKFSHN